MNARPILDPASIAQSPRTASILHRNDGPRQTVLGDNQTVKLTGADTQGRFTLIENINPPGTTLPMHIHWKEDEVFYVLEGQVEFTADGTSSVCEAGATVHLPIGVPHTWKVVGDAPARMLIMLMPAGLEGYFADLAELRAAGPPDMEKVLEISAHYGIEFPGLSDPAPDRSAGAL